MAVTSCLGQSGERVSIRCRPEHLEIDLAATALIVVDMQNAYASSGGYLDLAGFDISGAAKATENCSRLVALARRHGVQVVFLQNGWDPHYAEAGGPGSPNWHKSNALRLMRQRPDLGGKLLARGGWDYALIDALEPAAGDLVIPKTRYSGFFNSNLDSALRSRGIRNLLFCGIATNVCVESTLRDGFFLEYFGVLVEDASHQAGPESVRQATVFNVETFFGWVCTTEDLCQAVERV